MGGAESERVAKLQRIRLRMTGLSVVNTVVESVILALFALQGEAPWPRVLACAAVAVGSSLGFYVVVRRGWNLRWSDATLLLAQFNAGIAMQLAFMLLLPKLWFVFVLAILVTYVFGMVSFDSRRFTLAWLLIGAAVGVAFWLVRDRFAYPAVTPATLFVLWLTFVVALRQLTTIGVQFSALRAQLSEKNRQLSQSVARIEELARIDELTGVLNRRAFMEALDDEMRRAQRSAQRFSVALLDIDHFKAVNDRHSHQAGDEVLRQTCQAARACLRSTDRFARYGGEEFVLLLTPLNDSALAQIVSERVRQAIEQHRWPQGLPAVTVSVGVATVDADDTVERLIARADAALYRAKGEGRNRVVVHA